MDSLHSFLTWIYIALMVGVLIAGFNRRVVIYYNEKDLVISLGIIPAFICTIIMLVATGFEGQDDAYSYWFGIFLAFLPGSTALILLYLNFYYAIRHNRSFWIGILVGCIKIPFAWNSFVAICGLTVDVFGKDGPVSKRVFSALWVGILTWFLAAMINGEEVYEKKGWKQ